jgi:hypothetical protein
MLRVIDSPNVHGVNSSPKTTENTSLMTLSPSSTVSYATITKNVSHRKKLWNIPTSNLSVTARANNRPTPEAPPWLAWDSYRGKGGREIYCRGGCGGVNVLLG